VIGVRQPPVRKLPNLTAARALRALEVVVFHPVSAPCAVKGTINRVARQAAAR
jgi:hypothetical protein